ILPKKNRFSQLQQNFCNKNLLRHLQRQYVLKVKNFGCGFPIHVHCFGKFVHIFSKHIEIQLHLSLRRKCPTLCHSILSLYSRRALTFVEYSVLVSPCTNTIENKSGINVFMFVWKEKIMKQIKRFLAIVIGSLGLNLKSIVCN